MSRCFPFPPPGYEKKIRIEEADSIIKEKQKEEKKHKKEKKDREKKEGKEKRVKETSKDKHKERKERKEKHKDRKDKKDKNRDKEKSRSSEDKESASVLPNTGDREKIVTNTSQNNGNGESKFVQDLARRIRNEEEATESQRPRKIGFPGEVTETNISCSVPQTNHTKVDEKRNFTTAKRSETAVLPLSSCMDQKQAEVMVKPVAKKDQTKKKELQEKNHCRESVRKSDKPLDNEWIQKNEPKNITDRSSKEKKEVINKNVQEKPKFVEGGPRLEERGHNSVGTRDFRVQDLSKAGVKNLTSEEILSKQKDLETNGFLYENGSRPNKIQRPVASSLSSMENGRKLGACQTSLKPVSELQGTICNPELKEHRINGFTDPQETKILSSVKLKENGEASARKRPHPDLKYLDQILEVPKREELHEVEQEWLCEQSGVKLLKKQRTDSTSSLDDETPQVWNQALRIESADIVALPYVIPF